MDLDSIKSDAYAELGLELGWGDDDDGTRDLKHDIVDALVPFVSKHVARATADAIADKIEAGRPHIPLSDDPKRREHLIQRVSLNMAARIARAHGRMPETDTTEATE